MGIIRLTLIAAALIWLAMLYFGRDEGLPEDRLGRFPPPPSAEPEPAPEPTPAATEAPPAPAPETLAPVATEPPAAPAAPAPAQDVAAEEPPETPEAELAPAEQPEPDPTPEPEAVQPAEPVLYVTGTRVNVRAGPSTAYGPITSLTRGAAVVDLGDAGAGWRVIRLETGERGYMSADFLSPDAP